MDRAALAELWRANKDRPVWVREHREAIMAHVDTDDPIPSSGTAAVSRWLDRYKGTVTRQLNDETETDEVVA